MQILRDYQIEGANAVMAEFAKGVLSTCVVWATGLGKTSLAAEIVSRFAPKQVLFVCERTQLVNQAAARIEAHTGLRCAVERGEHRVNPGLLESGLPIVASIQSLNSTWGDGRRMHKFKPDLVIVDEFHHSAAPQYERLFSYLPPTCFRLGLSATPKRLDGLALGKHFQTVAHKFELQAAIEAGWLCDIAQEFIRVQELDFSKIRTVRGDLDQKQLAAVMEAENIVQRTCQPSLEILFGVERGSLATLTPDQWGIFLQSNASHAPFPAIMFCVTVKHAELAAEVLNRGHRDIAKMICAKTPEEDRQELFRDFRAGKFSVLTNCGVLGEGVDLPEVTVVFQCRATKSLGVWTQQLGRGARTLPGTIDGLDTPELRKGAIAASKKQFVRVVDFVGNSGRHKLISSIDVLGGDYSEAVREQALTSALERNKPVKMSSLLVNVEISEARRRKELEESKRRAEDVAKRHLTAAVNYSSRTVNPFEQSMQPEFQSVYRGPSATPKQIKVIARAGVHPDWWGKRKASWIIGKLIENDWRLPAEMEFLKRPKHQKAV